MYCINNKIKTIVTKIMLFQNFWNPHSHSDRPNIAMSPKTVCSIYNKTNSKILISELLLLTTVFN